MAITFRHDAAAVVPPSNSATRKYGQQLVLQQQQQKYAAQQAGYDRMFDAYKQANQAQFVLNRDMQQNAFQMGRDKQLNQFDMERDKIQFDRQQQQQEAERQRAFMEDARKQSGRFIMDSIEAGEYDPNTARELRQNLIDEAEALGNPNLDATQRAEALNKIRSRRATLSANRMPKAPPPTAQEQFDKGIVTDPATGMRYRQNSKGDYEPMEQPKQEPRNAAEAFRADPKLRDRYAADAINSLPEEERTDREKVNKKAMELYDIDQRSFNPQPTAAPELPGGSADPAVPGQSRSILEGPTAQLPDPGQPPAPTPTMSMDQYRAQMEQQGYKLVTPEDGTSPYYLKDSSAQGQYGVQMEDQGYKLMTPPDGGKPYYYKDSTPQMAAMPDEGQPPAPGIPAPVQPPAAGTLPLTANSSSQNPAASMRATPQSVSVGGKQLTVSPGTLTPQETAARDEIMKLPREERIAKLIPYDPELKGKTLDQILEDPATKAGYDELTKQGLTTGNYREDMLTQLDEMLQHNVMKGAGTTPPDAYVGMNVNEITDPKVKAQFDKVPRPKTPQDMLAVTGPYFIDPNGIIRGTQK